MIAADDKIRLAPSTGSRDVAWLLLLFFSLLLTGAAASARDAAGEQLLDEMLGAIGGRQAWAGLRNTVNGSQQNRAQEPTVVYAVISMDFEKPRFRIETTGPDLMLIRVIDGEDSWRLNRQGVIEDLPADRLRDDLQWYAAHLYRSIHRLAARDPALSPRSAGARRLEVFEGQQRLLWFTLDAKGEPYLFGVRDSDSGSLLGPWDFVEQGIHHPRWVSSPDGTWRAAVKALSVNVPLHDATFQRPAVADGTPRSD